MFLYLLVHPEELVVNRGARLLLQCRQLRSAVRALHTGPLPPIALGKKASW